MSKLCPITNEQVVYLVCQECEDKVCQRASCDYNALLDSFVCSKCRYMQDIYFSVCPDCGAKTEG